MLFEDGTLSVSWAGDSTLDLSNNKFYERDCGIAKWNRKQKRVCGRSRLIS